MFKYALVQGVYTCCPFLQRRSRKRITYECSLYVPDAVAGADAMATADDDNDVCDAMGVTGVTGVMGWSSADIADTFEQWIFINILLLTIYEDGRAATDHYF